MFARLFVAALLIANASALFAQRVASPREMLDIVQVDASQRKHFVDDRPLTDESETLGRILFRLPSFSQADIDRWTKVIEEPEAMLRNPDSYRFEMFDVRGVVASLRRIQVIPELVQRLGFDEYFEIDIQHDEIQSTIYCRDIPKRWRAAFDEQPLAVVNGETIRAQALLLKRTLDENGKRSLVFAAPRINWHPSKSSASLGTTEDQVLLGQLGLDIDRLSDLVQKAKMTSKDRECFYQSLAAVRLVEPEQLARLGRKEFEIARMIQTPQDVAGELYTLHGLARRAIMIRVEDKDIQERFGIDHYFEIEVFMELERKVRFVDPNDPQDAEGKVFNDYPFVICVAELPPGMKQGDDIRVPITFSGFFLKLWAYETEFMSGGRARTAKPRLQQSPLLVGPTVTVGEQFSPEESQLSLIIACLFTGCLLAVWVLLWRASVQDGRKSKQLFRKHDATEGAFDGLD